jgi:hypothetical protein
MTFDEACYFLAGIALGMFGALAWVLYVLP